MTVTTIAAMFVMMGKIQDAAVIIDKSVRRYKARLQRGLAERLSEKGLGGGPRPAATDHWTDPTPELSISSSLAIASKYYFVTFPVSEIREATRLYGLLDQSRNGDEFSSLEITDISEQNSSRRALLENNASSGASHRNTIQTTRRNGGSSAAITGTQENPARLRHRVQFSLESRTERPPRAHSAMSPRIPPSIFSRVSSSVRRRAKGVLLVTARVFMLCVWIPLVLLEYLALLVWEGFRRTRNFFGLIPLDATARDDGLDLNSSGNTNTSGSNTKNSSNWTQLLGFFTYQLSVLLSGESRHPPPPDHGGHRREDLQQPEMLDVSRQRPLRPPQTRAVFVRAAAAWALQDQEFVEQQQQQQQQQQQEQRAWLSHAPSPRFPSPNQSVSSVGSTWSRQPSGQTVTTFTDLGGSLSQTSPRPVATFVPTRVRGRWRGDLDLEA